MLVHPYNWHTLTKSQEQIHDILGHTHIHAHVYIYIYIYRIDMSMWFVFGWIHIQPLAGWCLVVYYPRNPLVYSGSWLWNFTSQSQPSNLHSQLAIRANREADGVVTSVPGMVQTPPKGQGPRCRKTDWMHLLVIEHHVRHDCEGI